MGFDIDCVIDLHTYPGEYFCPVCRMLVYPNEAFQTPCTHLYCKPCLSHIANGTRACPYDGYLVTEADSKILMESDKVLSEKVRKVRVRCLYFRNGCTWDGALSDCVAHCSLCPFANSPVICYRCGMHILHRQLHQHARFCPGGAVPNLVTLDSATGDVNQALGQSVEQNPSSQNVNGASAAVLSGQYAEMAVTSNSLAPSTVPTQDQWYQQQYYAQYAGFDPYQQFNQLSSSSSSSIQQQHLQNPVQVEVQQQSYSHLQPQPASQGQLQLQLPTQPSPVQQPQAQAQVYFLPLFQNLPQAVTQSHGPTPGLSSGYAPIRSVTPTYQATMNPLSNPPIRPPVQIAHQTLAPQPYSGQQVSLPLVTQHQQTHMQVQHPVASQVPPRPQGSHVEFVNQQMQLLFQQPYYSQPQPPSLAPAVLPLASRPTLNPVNSYQQHQPVQKIHPQNQVPTYQPVLPLNPDQSQTSPIQPLDPHVSIPQVQLSVLPWQSYVPAAGLSQNQQFQPQGQKPVQIYPSVQPVQQAVAQQNSVTAFESQLRQQGYILQQNTTQVQMRPSVPVQHQEPQSFTARPMAPTQAVNQRSYSSHSGNFANAGSAATMVQGSVNQTNLNSPVILQNTSVPGSASLSRRPSGGEPTVAKVQTGGDAASSDLHKSTQKNGESNFKVNSSAFDMKASDAGYAEVGFAKEDQRYFAHSDSQEADIHEQDKPPYMMIAAPSSIKHDQKIHSSLPCSSVESDLGMQHSYSAHERNLEAQPQGQPHTAQGRMSSGNLPHLSSSNKERRGIITDVPGSAIETFECQSSLHGLASFTVPDQHGTKRRATVCTEDQFGSQHVEFSRDKGLPGFGGETVHNDHAGDPGPLRMKGQVTLESSSFGCQDEKGRALTRENSNIFPTMRERAADVEKFDKANQVVSHNSGNLDSRTLTSHSRLLHSRELGHADITRSGPEYGRQEMKHFIHQPPDRRHAGFSTHEFRGPSSAFDDTVSHDGLRFGERPRSFDNRNLPPFHAHHVRRGYLNGPRYHRSGDEHIAPGFFHTPAATNHNFGPDRPENFIKDHVSEPGLRFGDFNIAEISGIDLVNRYGHPGAFNRPSGFPRFPPREPVAVGISKFPQFGEPAMMSSSISSIGHFARGDVDAIHQYRKRKPASSGWCRICEVDCETIQGLELHSQRREHQKMALDMVQKMKLQNKRSSFDYMVSEGASRARKSRH